jgi:hypothetical protein
MTRFRFVTRITTDRTAAMVRLASDDIVAGYSLMKVVGDYTMPACWVALAEGKRLGFAPTALRACRFFY